MDKNERHDLIIKQLDFQRRLLEEKWLIVQDQLRDIIKLIELLKEKEQRENKGTATDPEWKANFSQRFKAIK